MRRSLVVFWLVAAASSPNRLAAQSIQGRIQETDTRRPIAEVTLTLLDASGKEFRIATRSDSTGAFRLNIGRPETYRVRATRIGYQPTVSDPIRVNLGEMVSVVLGMTTVPQRVAPVTVTERRRLSPRELMSPMGFEMRRNRGIGQFEDAETLADYGRVGMDEVVRGGLLRGVRVVTGEYGDRIQAATRSNCNPTLWVDGWSVGNGPEGLARLSVYMAKDLYSVESYGGPGRPIPPAGLGGHLGGECGYAIAVWTKAYVNWWNARNVPPPPGVAAPGTQVVRGQVVEDASLTGLRGARVTLLSTASKVIERAIPVDSGGNFAIPTTEIGDLRLRVEHQGYGPVVTPAFALGMNDMLIVRVSMSRTPLLAPLAVVSRERGNDIAMGSTAGFDARVRRGVGGHFLVKRQLAGSTAGSLLATLGAIDGVVVSGTGDAQTVRFRRTTLGITTGGCEPSFFLDGAPIRADRAGVLDRLGLGSLHGVEIYLEASRVPGEFSAGAADCGAVLIWTDRSQPGG